MRKLLFVLLLAAFGARPAAQSTTTDRPTQEPTFRTGVEVTTVDVAVVDRMGRPVEDLRAPEFAVKIDGELRRVISAELVKVDIEAARKQVADKSETFFTSNLTPPHGRQIILAFDQMNLSPGAVRPILAAASRFLDKLSPLDQVAFLTFPEPGPRVGFTSDRVRLRTAMQSIVGHPAVDQGGRFNIGVSEALAITDRRDPIALGKVMDRECQVFEDPQSLNVCERLIVNEAAAITRRVREDAQQSLIGLRQMLERLALVDGPKSLIVLSEGLAIDDQSQLDSIVRLAGQARASINVMQLDLKWADVTVSKQPPSESQDRKLQTNGLETLASISRGALYRVVGTGDDIFDRLASEISAYYLLGVEQRPGDLTGDRHRIDVDVRRRNVTIRSRQAFVLSPVATSARSPVERLREALGSPFPTSGLPLRVTTFTHQDPASEKVRVMIAAQVGQPGAKPGDFDIGYLVVDDQNRVAASYGEKRRLTPGGASANEPLQFVGAIVLDPGVYSLRFAVVDGEGRRGSIVRELNAWKLKGEEFALGDLVVGNMPARGQSINASVEPHITHDGVAAFLELYSTSAATWERATVTFEIADSQDAPALTSINGQLQPGAQPTWRAASVAMGAGALPSGRYVVRARVQRDGKMVGLLARPFVLERARVGAAVDPLAVATGAALFATSLPRFDRDTVLGREFLGSMLSMVEKRSAALKDAMVEARAGRYGAAALEALTTGDQPVAAFLRGIDLLIKGQLDQAATQLQIAAGPRREFFPAAFYLGAAFASVGRDRDAAGVWQMALGSEPRPPAIYLMVADARMRDGQADSAIDILKPAYEREPANDEFGRRLSMAYVITGKHGAAMPILDAMLTRRPADQEALLAAIICQYELVRAGQSLSSVERGKLRKYAQAYTGTQQALVKKYLTAMQ